MTGNETTNRAAVRARVDGWPIHLASLAETVHRIAARAEAGSGFTVFTLNLDHLVKLRTSKPFAAAYRTADLVTADGAPVAWLSRFQDPSVRRTTGADLFIPLASEASRRGLPIYLFGATFTVLSQTAETLRAKSDGVMEIAGLSAPSADFDPEGREADLAIERIEASGARLCFVALGAPKQEVFAARAVAKGCAAGFVCIGAAVDFVAGTQVRAPLAFQRCGMEWVWRLAHNPRRLARRYGDCARVLLDLAVLAPVRSRLTGRVVS